MISPQRRQEIIDALRRGTVPRRSLDAFAVGLERFEEALANELKSVAGGSGVFKAVRGEYGSGKTFFARWLQERAKKQGLATAEVQISETETPLHRLETVYRRLIERLSTRDTPQGALRGILDAWFYALEEDVLAAGSVDETDAAGLLAHTSALMEQRLAAVNRLAPSFATALRAYRRAQGEGDNAQADGLLAWLSGEPNVGVSTKRYAGIKGDVDHFGALSFLQGLLVILRDSGLNALRQLLDEVDSGRFPGLYLLITGTRAFYQGPQGVQRLAPLAQRLQVDFTTDPRFDNPRAVQIRLAGFDQQRLELVGTKIRDIYAEQSGNEGRIRSLADDGYIAELGRAVAGNLGGKVGIAPRLFLKKLVGDVLDRIDQFPDFDPRQHYALTVTDTELTETERNARAAASPDDIELKL